MRLWSFCDGTLPSGSPRWLETYPFFSLGKAEFDSGKTDYIPSLDSLASHKYAPAALLAR